MTNRDRSYINAAVAYALEKGKLRVRVAAVSSNYYYGVNEAITHPALKRWKYPPGANLHAELALALYGYANIGGGEVWVARITRDGAWAMAKPCACCMAVLAHLYLKRIVWTTGPSTIEEVRL